MALNALPSYDVVVAGGGPSGLMAAIAAARTGARTLLVEQNGYVGGLAVIGLPLHGFYNNREERIMGGIPREMVERLMDMDAAADARNTAIGPPRGRGSPKFNAKWIIYDPEAFKYLALEMLQESGVELLLHTFVSDVVLDGGSIAGLVVEGKSGRSLIPAARVVDCTGDGDVAARAGAPFEKGREGDAQLQPMTPLFILSGVNTRLALEAATMRLRPMQTIGSAYWESHCHGYNVDLTAWRKPLHQEIPEFAEILSAFNAFDYGTGVLYCGNMIHIPGLDGSDSASLTRAEMSGRTLVWRLVQFLRLHVAGFQDAHLVSTLPWIGVRETRRILGDYVLGYEDVVAARHFDDVIGLCGYRVDIHGYDGGPVYDEPKAGTQVEGYGAYDIPYRCLLPQRVENLLVAGRCVSATHEAQGSLRVMGTCMGMGHAAGTAAALSVQEDVPPRELAVSLLTEALLDQGADLGERYRS